MLMEAPPDQHEALLSRLAERGFTVRDAVSDSQPIENLPATLAGSLAARFAPEGMRQVFQQARGEIGLERSVARGIGKTGKAATEAIGEVSPMAGKVAEFALPQDEFGGQAMLFGGPAGRMAAEGALAMRPAAKAVTSATRSMLAYAQSKGIPLTAAEISGSKVIAQLENLLDKTPLGHGAIQRFRDRQVEAIRNLRDQLAQKMGTSEDAAVVGQMAKDAIAANSQKMRGESDALYGALGEKAAGAQIPIGQTKQAAKMLLDKEMKAAPQFRNEGIVKMAQNILSVEAGAVDFDNLQAMRRYLGGIIEAEDAARALGQPGVKFMGSAEAGAAKLLTKSSEADLGLFAAAGGEDIKKTYDAARTFYREGRAVFNEKSVRAALKADPERVVDVVFRPGAITTIRAVKKAAGQAGFAPLKQKFIEKVIPEVGDNFSPGAFRRALDKYGDDTLKEIFEPAELSEITRMADISSRLQMANKLPGTQGSARTNAALLTGLGAGYVGVLTPGGVGILLAPKVLAELYVTDAGRKLLTEGFSIAANSPRAAKAAGAISGYLATKGALPREKK